jgi:pyruvate,water dikinase
VVPDRVLIGSPQVQRWCEKRGVESLAVRSAFGAEDRSDDSLAGWFESELDVQPADIEAAIDRVRASAARRDGQFRLDVLIMGLVDAEHAGVSFSEPGTYDDVVNVTEGLADKLLGGTDAGERIELPRIEQAESGWRRRLQLLLRRLRAEFGDTPWDVEWADDGTTCWLLQIRPVTAPTLRNETMTLANHAEILPPLPSHLMASVIEAAGPDLFEWYRSRIPGLPSERDFLHVVAGRPMINLSLLEDMMRHLGLPTALVADSIGGGTGEDRPLNPLRALRSLPSLMRLGLSQLTAVLQSTRNRTLVRAGSGTRNLSTFTQALDDLHDAYVALVTGMFPLSSAIGPPLALLRATGTLYEHAARHRTITAEMAERMAALRAHTVGGAGENEVSKEKGRFLADFGHRGVYESDIARPRYRDDPALVVTSTDQAAHTTPSRPPKRTLRGLLTWPLWLLASRPLAARELLRHDAMRRFADIRASLAASAATAVGRGQLRTADDLWLLTAAEARCLDHGWQPDAGFWSEREIERSRLASIDVPHVVGRFDDPSSWSGDHCTATHDLRGLPLTTGTVVGVAWVLDEPASELPEGFDRSTTILIARSLDAGWIGTLQLVAGVVAEIGGDLSHGSILVRELGLPAITNATGATRRIRTGDPVNLRAASGTLDIAAP